MALAGRSFLNRLLRPTVRNFCDSASAQEASSSSSGIGVVEFLKSIGHGVDAHADKVAKEIESLDQLLLVRRIKLKKIGVPCKQRKMIMRYTEKFRQNLWKPKTMEA